MTQVEPRRYLICPPTHFTVRYAINPWMDPDHPVDTDLAGKQWHQLREALRELGEVYELPPVPGLPDQVYAANGGFVLDGTAYGARFRHPQRAGEEAVHRRWYTRHGWRFVAPTAVNEGEGDLLWTDGMVLAGHGFRTTRAAHREVREIFGRRVVPLRLVDPRYYHLDTALAVLREDPVAPAVAYYPDAFSPGSRRLLRRLFPDAVIAGPADAAGFGLNLVSDGRQVVLNAEAAGFADRLAGIGYAVHPVDLSELKKGGGSAKCCVLELRVSPGCRAPGGPRWPPPGRPGRPPADTTSGSGSGPG